MSKIVLVETVSMFKHVYAVEIGDEDHESWACHDVVRELSKEDPGIEEVGQKWISEETFSHRVIDEKEYLQIYDEMNGPYFVSEWSDEKKKKFIFKSKKSENYDPDVDKGIIKDWEC